MASWFRFFGSELRLMLTKRRNIAGLGILALLPILLGIGLRYGGGGGAGLFDLARGNGLLVPLAALTVAVTMFLPLAIAMVCGDSIAGEAQQGTLRYLLTVPVGRTRLLFTKFASLAVGALVATTVMSLSGAVTGVILFGAGPAMTFSGTTMSVPETLWRVMLATLYVSAGLIALAAVGLFFSTLTEQPIAAMVIVMVVVAAMWIVSGLEQLAFMHPWLLVQQWTAFIDLLRDPPLWSAMGTGLLVDAGYTLVFLSAAWAHFTSKDVTS